MRLHLMGVRVGVRRSLYKNQSSTTHFPALTLRVTGKSHSEGNRSVIAESHSGALDLSIDSLSGERHGHESKVDLAFEGEWADRAIELDQGLHLGQVG